MELELVNRKNMELQLIPLFNYKINNKKLIFFESQNSYSNLTVELEACLPRTP